MKFWIRLQDGFMYFIYDSMILIFNSAYTIKKLFQNTLLKFEKYANEIIKTIKI